MFTRWPRHFLTTSMTALILFSAPTMAEQKVQGGIIHFRGEIVESPCDVSSSQQQVSMSCAHNGAMKTNQFTLQQVSTAPQQIQQVANVKMQYLNAQKNMAILSIEYK
ncbi:type 1 fimbrial protein [Citrobacter enshiensis]|uniref:type 1 fimbrial protein n=1 Tax=Citrobacter enshiensis TaxID=2971264 RepID=UPI0023E7E30D|nr:type 1 fimbrial protein [Citrobacter enshiensis]WET39171.1 type 1 fimbrial protein [Citrobacter enshiensis]